MPHRAAELRAGGESGELHAGRHDIDSVDQLAVHLLGSVEALERIADQLEGIHILERGI